MSPSRPRLLPFDAARYLTDDEAIAEYINAVLETGAPGLLPMALEDVVRAWHRADAGCLSKSRP